MAIVMPRKTTAGVLLALNRELAEQSTAFREFNTDLSLKLKQSFSESMGPLQQRMIEVIEELSRQLRAAEAEKGQSISDNLSVVLSNLEKSISTTLGNMGDRFTEALSGSAKTQFKGLSDSLSDATALIQQMNLQSRANQDSLNELMTLARSTIADQLAAGKIQMQELAATLNNMVERLSETSGSSVANLSAALNVSVGELSTRITMLSEQMTNTVIAGTERAAGAAQAVIEKADTWSASTTEQFQRLLEQHSNFLDRVSGASLTMNEAVGQLKDVLPQLAVISKEFRGVVAEVNSAATRTAQATASMQMVADSVGKMVGYAQQQTAAFSQATKQIQEDMKQYEEVFARLRGQSGAVLEQIGRNLLEYTQVSRNGFEGILKSANDHMGTAVRRLGDSITGLDEYLQELTEVLGKRSPQNRPK